MQHRSVNKIAILSFVALPIMTLADCGPLSNAYGPYDYRTITQQQKALVEDWHFNPAMQSMQGGEKYLAGNYDYTLRAFPNHPRALYNLSMLSFRVNKEKLEGAHYTVQCYFERAVKFRPDDGEVHMVYGIHLLKKGDKNGALSELNKAQELVGDNANVHYNLGLVYFDLQDYEKSLFYAHSAYKLGFQLAGLRNKLVKAGKWRDPEPNTQQPAP